MKRSPFPRIACFMGVALAWLLAPGAGTLRAETLTLAQCLRETAARNPQIIEQQYAVQRATAARLTLRARALPTLTVGGILGYLGEENTETLAHVPSRDPTTGVTTFSTQTNKRAGTELIIGTGELDQPIFDAAIPASWRRGDIGITVAQENFYTVAAAQLHATRTLFYQALFQQENGAVLRRLDDVLAGEIKSFDQLVTAGIVGRQGLLAAQVQRTNFNTAILAAAGSVRVDVTSLLQSMGRDLGPDAPANIRLDGSLDEHAFSFDAAAMAREALAHRPDIRGLRAAVRSITEDANISRAGYYPLIRLYVAGELIPQSFVQHTQPNSVRQSDQTQTTEVRPGIREDWTIIDTGSVRGTVRELEAQRDQIVVALQQAERNLPSELALVRARMADASNKITALRSNVGTAENTLNMIQAGVAQGIDNQIEALDAENGVLATRSGLLGAELEMSLARADFDRLTGRYLRFTPDAPVHVPSHP